MKTLVIHPQDSSTDFLCEIYKDLECEVINDNYISINMLAKIIFEYDRIIMMGHGDPNGLYRVNSGRSIGYMIDHKYIELLREKQNNVFIWCNADRFVRKFKLKGFVTGMIISENAEALYFSILPKNNEVEQSNKLFSESIKNHINSESKLMCEGVKNEYKSEDNQIILYNQENIYNF